MASQKSRLTFSSVPSLSNYIAYVESQTLTGPVTRLQALSVPAVFKGRNLICSISTLTLDVFDSATNEKVDNPLFRQFDPDVTNVVHLSQTLEDLLMDGIAWWEIVHRGWDQYPDEVRRLDPGVVSLSPPPSSRSQSPLPSGVDPRGAVVYVDGRPVPFSQIIRFDSPNPGILTYGAQAIRRAILLDQAAKMYAANPDAAEILRVPDEYEDDQAKLFADNYVAAKRKRSTVSLPVDVTIERPASANPSEIQLVDLQKQVTVEISNFMGLDAEEFGVPITSRTYSNVQDRRRDTINETLAPFMRAITDRLSMSGPPNSNYVTKRGQVARFNLTDYLKASDKDRAEVQKLYVDMGVISPQEVRELEQIPGPVPEKPEPPAAPPMPQPDPSANTDSTVEEPVAATNSRSLVPAHFEDSKPGHRIPVLFQNFSVDRESRTIEGVAVVYGATGNGVRFQPGSLKFSNVSNIKLNLDHDPTKTVGVTTYLADSKQGLKAKFRVAKTAAGDEALELADAGVYDGLSIEIDPNETQFTADPKNKRGQLVTSAPLIGVALTPSPAFTDARITAVTFSEGEQQVPEETPVVEETAPEVAPVVAPTPAPAPEAPAATEFARPVVNPTRPVAATQVSEAAPYTFNRRGQLVRGSHEFADDLRRMSYGDIAARDRATSFVASKFSDDPILQADVNELAPTVNINKYIDEKDYAYPLWSRLGRGAPPNGGGNTTFQHPVFASSAIVVAAHTENTPQDSKDYVTTSVSVTPAANSGRVEITRETWDHGNVPGLSDLIWRKMLRAWGERREAVIDAALDAQEVSGMTELGTFTAGADGATLGATFESAFSGLHFIRGGFRFDFVAAQADLFAALVAATDDIGRPLYPVSGASNANGTTGGKFGTLEIGGVPFVPSWAAAAAGQTATASSFLIDSTAVDAWATAPQRIDIVQSVEMVEIAIWGYMAAIVSDAAGTRHIGWDPVA